MTVRRIHPSFISSNNTSDGSVLVYNAANGVVEFGVAAGGGGDVSNAWVNANDYATYTTLQGDLAANDYSTYTTLVGFINTVQDNAAALDNNVWVNANDYSTYLQAQANDYSTYSTLTANIYNTFAYLDANVGGGGSGNTSITVADTEIANTSIIVEAGDGIAISGNSTSHVLTISTLMSNASAQVIPVDGSANNFTTIKAVANNNMVLVSYNGILQDFTKYSWDGAEITLSNTDPLAAGSNLEIRYFDFFSLPGTSAGGGEVYSFQGSVSGYNSGGNSPGGIINTIDKFSFSSDGNAADVGDLTVSRSSSAGQSSSTSGYTSGGTAPAVSNVVDKFPFSSDSNATDVGDLTQARSGSAGQSSSESGYTSGGSVPAASNIIDKFPFSSDANATDVGNLTQARYASAGQSSTASGYTSGGLVFNTIDKFSFSADGNATDVGDLTSSRFGGGGQSSDVSGYIAGGRDPSLSPTDSNIIEKFPFASDANSTDVGDLTIIRYGAAGQSSTESGYASGGRNPSVIDKFPFATDTNATDVGDLTVATTFTAGQQV